MFIAGVQRFAKRVREASGECLIVYVCPLDLFVKDNKAKLEKILLTEEERQSGKDLEQTTIISHVVKELKDGKLFHMVHGYPSYWGDEVPGAEIINTVPFGMTAKGVDAWLASERGSGLRKIMYAAHKLVAFSMGNTGVQMGGWFTFPVNSVNVFRGKKIRISGLGGKVLRKFYADPVTWSESEIVKRIEQKSVDDVAALEWVGPYADLL